MIVRVLPWKRQSPNTPSLKGLRINQRQKSTLIPSIEHSTLQTAVPLVNRDASCPVAQCEHPGHDDPAAKAATGRFSLKHA
jgi:hypothetical protein